MSGEPTSASPEHERREEPATPVAPPPVAHAPGSPRNRRRLRVAAVIGLVAAAGFAVWYFALREPEPRNDAERFQGDWQVSVGDRRTPNVVRVGGDLWHYTGPGGNDRVYRMVLNEAADPKEIDLVPADAAGFTGPVPKLHGVYAFDGNSTARVRLEPGINPRPKAVDEPEAVVWVLTRVRLEPAPEPPK